MTRTQRFWLAVARAAGVVARKSILRATGKPASGYSTLEVTVHPANLSVVLLVNEGDEKADAPMMMRAATFRAALAALQEAADDAEPCNNPDCPVCAPKRAGRERTTQVH